MKIISQKTEKSEMEVKISIPFSEQKKNLELAAQKISKEKPLAGFRPGKAPYEMVERRVGAMAILEMALPRIVEEAYIQMLKDERQEAVGQPKVDMEKVVPNDEVVFKVKFSLLPQIKIGDYKKIKVKRKKPEVEEKKVERALKDLQRMQHKEALVDRKAESADKVVIDIDMYQEKVPIEGGTAKAHQIYLKDEYYIPGLKEKIIGMKKGEVKEFELSLPKDYSNKSMAGKKMEFKIKLNDVYQIDLPELDDDFAKTLKLDSLKALKEQLKKNLMEEEKGKTEQKAELEMIDEIIKISRIDDIPQVLLDNETEKMISELKSEITAQGADFEQYLASIKKNSEEIKLDFMDQAVRRIKMALITRQLALEKEIKLTEEELKAELEKLRGVYKNDEKSLEYINSPSYEDYLKNLLTNRKVIDILKKECITDK